MYISFYQDRYYTNGAFLNYSYLSTKASEKVVKKIYNFQIGQKLYSPFKANVRFLREHDRPFAGYLYGGFGISYFFKKKSLFRINAEVGVIGPSAFGKESMNFVHDIYGFDPATGWKYQIQDAFALNFNAEFTKQLTTSKYIDLNWVNTGNLGTVFSDISTGFLSRIGIKPIQDLANSIAFNSNLNNEVTNFNNEIETFFYINPMLRYAIYDATIQGSFLNDNNPVTFELKPFVLTTEIGFKFTANRFNFKYAIIHHTKKLKSINVPNGNFYGSIAINYLFN
ncbi:conserved protein of unknown function [Tenacibaculum jejuense]|uniref:Outer membrane protein n=1 Tax=Tenacibaculum jejuense TaxID=584609 RepID=A0A238U7U4_9FLAO|nr:conserved protein of unknown function [Tenacibaculum jejuense]